jgi:hypothetical protein
MFTISIAIPKVYYIFQHEFSAGLHQQSFSSGLVKELFTYLFKFFKFIQSPYKVSSVQYKPNYL